MSTNHSTELAPAQPSPTPNTSLPESTSIKRTFGFFDLPWEFRSEIYGAVIALDEEPYVPTKADAIWMEVDLGEIVAMVTARPPKIPGMSIELFHISRQFSQELYAVAKDKKPKHMYLRITAFDIVQRHKFDPHVEQLNPAETDFSLIQSVSIALPNWSIADDSDSKIMVDHCLQIPGHWFPDRGRNISAEGILAPLLSRLPSSCHIDVR